TSADLPGNRRSSATKIPEHGRCRREIAGVQHRSTFAAALRKIGIRAVFAGLDGASRRDEVRTQPFEEANALTYLARARLELRDELSSGGATAGVSVLDLEKTPNLIQRKAGLPELARELQFVELSSSKKPLSARFPRFGREEPCLLVETHRA